MQNNELYVTGVVIPNGLADHEGDILNKKDILKIFTKYTERATDTMHTKIRNAGVDVLANWISETDTEIAGRTAPAGSWLATLKVRNAEIIKSIQDGNIRGFSLGSIPSFALKQDFWFINKSVAPRQIIEMNYSDLDDAEDVVPLFISLVDKPSNMFGLEIMDYDVFINKRAKNIEVETMTEQKNEEMVSMGTLEKIADIFGINKRAKNEDATIEEPVIEKSETAPAEEQNMSNDELLNAIDAKIDAKLDGITEKVSDGVVSAFEKLPEILNSKKEETKAEPVKTEEPAKDDEVKAEEKTTAEKTEEVEIKKRATTKTENVETQNTTTNFYKMTGRDEFGVKIQK